MHLFRREGDERNVLGFLLFSLRSSSELGKSIFDTLVDEMIAPRVPSICFALGVCVY